MDTFRYALECVRPMNPYPISPMRSSFAMAAFVPEGPTERQATGRRRRSKIMLTGACRRVGCGHHRFRAAGPLQRGRRVETWEDRRERVGRARAVRTLACRAVRRR